LTCIAQGLIIDGIRRSKLEQRYKEQLEHLPKNFQENP
jgi:DNA-directed RNA polymerase specialized sigma24 family protein